METGMDTGVFQMLAGAMATVGVFALVIGVILIIANWKIFTKTGKSVWQY